LTEGKLFSMLRDIFDGAGKDCNVPVMFTSSGDKQENAVRSDLLSLLASPGVDQAAPLATRLQRCTSGSSGMGLLFICLGKDANGDERIVVSRTAVLSKVDPPRLVNEKFRFDAAEFSRHIAYKQIELDNDAVLSAPAEKFEQCFVNTKKKDSHTFTTTGHIVDERLKTTK
jgi:hypothetical protein